MPKLLTPYICPSCGNTSQQEGITLCYLEWRIMPVEGQTEDYILCHYDQNEGADISNKDKLTCTNVPDVAPDLEHFSCNKCQWNWVDVKPHNDIACF